MLKVKGARIARESGKEGGLGRMKEVARKKERGHNVREEWKEICRERDEWQNSIRVRKKEQMF